MNEASVETETKKYVGKIIHGWKKGVKLFFNITDCLDIDWIDM